MLIFQIAKINFNSDIICWSVAGGILLILINAADNSLIPRVGQVIKGNFIKMIPFLAVGYILWFLFFGSHNTNNPEITQKTEVDICRCLTEPGNSEYMTQNRTACDEAISKEIGVADWGKVNMKYDKVTSKKFDELEYKCTGKRPNAEISGTYSGTDNFGMESTIILRSGGNLIIQASVGDGTPDYGWWTGTADNLSLYHKDNMGDDELIGKAEVTEDGLKIVGGKFYSRK